MFLRDNKRILLHDDFNHANIPKRYWSASIDAIPENLEYKSNLKKILQDIKIYVGNGTGLFVFGDTGTGKTSLVCILLKELLAYGGSGYFVQTGELKNFMIKECLYDNGFSKYNILRRFEEVDLLVIDDLGLENTTDYFKGEFEILIRKRYGNNKSTIITTNLVPCEDARSVESIYGKALFSLIKESFKILKVNEYNWRK